MYCNGKCGEHPPFDCKTCQSECLWPEGKNRCNAAHTNVPGCSDCSAANTLKCDQCWLNMRSSNYEDKWGGTDCEACFGEYCKDTDCEILPQNLTSTKPVTEELLIWAGVSTNIAGCHECYKDNNNQNACKQCRLNLHFSKFEGWEHKPCEKYCGKGKPCNCGIEGTYKDVFARMSSLVQWAGEHHNKGDCLDCIKTGHQETCLPCWQNLLNSNLVVE